jgi:3-methylfumaryl-CoA hydratase
VDAQSDLNFDEWVGNSRQQRERIDTALPAGMSAALDRDDAAPEDGDALPPCWHWMFFRDSTVQSKLGADGLPERGGALMPPVPLPRRMWAASHIRFGVPLCLGETAVKRSEIAGISEKSGKSGRLVFVNLRHTVLTGSDEVAIEEEQNIVYTEAPKPGAVPAPRAAPGDAAWRRQLRPDPVMLFRYSALTFNPHRIHYDQPYCTQEEGYPDLVVHGPLIATLMVDLCRRSRPDAEIKEFSFRALAPLFVDRDMSVAGAPSQDGSSAAVWAANDKDELASQGEVIFA